MAAFLQTRYALAIKWLLCLGPFFYVSYGFANYWASLQANVPFVVFAWEAHIPFMAWTIIPYWTLNGFYALSLFIPKQKAEVNALGRRLLTAQMIAVSFFIACPLTYTVAKPASIDGVAGLLFTALAGFDKPFNQAPSLHIALVVLLLPTYWRACVAWLRPLLVGWFGLIVVSVLTTYQHHFIDIPTGALLGLFCLWLWPHQQPSPLSVLRLSPNRKRQQLALCYLLGAAALVALAYVLRHTGWGLWLLYPAVSCLFVAVFYGSTGAQGFQKLANGRHSLASTLCLAPYTLMAYLNSHYWLRNKALIAPVMDGVYLGSVRADVPHHMAMLDVCSELPLYHPPSSYAVQPMLDLIAPSAAELRLAVQKIETLRQSGAVDVLVCCALGYSRSASVVLAWLMHTHRAPTLQEAMAIVQKARPQIVLSTAHIQAIQESLL